VREIVDPPAAINKAKELRAKWARKAASSGRLVSIASCAPIAAIKRRERLWGDNGPRLRMIWTTRLTVSITPLKTPT